MKQRKLGNIVSGLAIAVCIATSSAAFAQKTMERGGMDETGPYSVVENWFKPGFDHWNQVVTSVAVDTPDRIFMASGDPQYGPPGTLIINADGTPKEMPRTLAPPPPAPVENTHLHQILVLNAEGKVVEDWSQWNDLIVLPHNILISPYDKDRHVWVIDREGHQILKFTNDGKKLVMTLGERKVPGTDHGHFDLPAGMAFLPDGSFYVADGYRNTRVIKFDKDGKFLLEWGSKGTGPGQFNLVHSVAVDSAKRVYVADRSNNRVQIFDESGKYLDQWNNIRSPAFLMVSADNKSLWLSSNSEDRIVKYDMNGMLQTYWGVHGTFAGAIYNFHNFSVDKNGTLYVADSFNNRVQKFVARPDANKDRLVDQPFVFK
jgi:DNA-binding beta-propeller fold protein YncE